MRVNSRTSPDSSRSSPATGCEAAQIRQAGRLLETVGGSSRPPGGPAATCADCPTYGRGSAARIAQPCDSSRRTQGSGRAREFASPAKVSLDENPLEILRRLVELDFAAAKVNGMLRLAGLKCEARQAHERRGVAGRDLQQRVKRRLLRIAIALLRSEPGAERPCLSR